MKLIRRERREGTVWLARWLEPDVDQEGKRRPREVSLDALGYTNAEARTRWAREKSEEIADRLRELKKGAQPHTGKTISDAIKVYFDGTDVGDATRANYRTAADRFLSWATRQGLHSTDDLRPEHLVAFRAALRAEPPRRAVTNGRRGEKASAGAGETSVVTTNNRLRGLKVVLNDLRRRGLLPHIDRDAIADRLRSYKEDAPRAAFLRPDKLRALLEAVERHDAACWVLEQDQGQPFDPERVLGTARELAAALGVHESRVSQLRREAAWPAGPPWRLGDVVAVLRARHEPATPLVLLALLTGARLEEMLTLRWEHVDLDHPDGVIEFDGKTGPREVWLDVTPSVKRLLLAMKLKAVGPFVFGGETSWTKTVADKMRRRLIRTYKAPDFTFAQRNDRTPSLRATCATYSVNAGSVWGDAAHFTSAKRLGHSVAIAEKRYAGRWRVPRDAKDLEAAMEVADALAHVVDVATGKVARARASS